MKLKNFTYIIFIFFINCSTILDNHDGKGKKFISCGMRMDYAMQELLSIGSTNITDIVSIQPEFVDIATFVNWWLLPDETLILIQFIGLKIKDKIGFRDLGEIREIWVFHEKGYPGKKKFKLKYDILESIDISEHLY